MASCANSAIGIYWAHYKTVRKTATLTLHVNIPLLSTMLKNGISQRVYWITNTVKCNLVDEKATDPKWHSTKWMISWVPRFTWVLQKFLHEKINISPFRFPFLFQRIRRDWAIHWNQDRKCKRPFTLYNCALLVFYAQINPCVFSLQVTIKIPQKNSWKVPQYFIITGAVLNIESQSFTDKTATYSTLQLKTATNASLSDV